jgi:hypothetical protein
LREIFKKEILSKVSGWFIDDTKIQDAQKAAWQKVKLLGNGASIGTKNEMIETAIRLQKHFRRSETVLLLLYLGTGAVDLSDPA